MLRKSGATRAAVRLSSLAVFTGLVAVAGSAAFGDTLAEWDLTGNLYNESSVPAEAGTLSAALNSASLAREASMGKQNSNVPGYGGKGFDTVSTFEEAVASNKYFDVAFSIAEGFSGAPTGLSYKYVSTSGSGPNKIRWRCLTNNVEAITFDEAAIKNTGKETATNLNLSALGELAAGTMVTLRMFAWGATTSSATFVFKNSMTLEGTATRLSGGPVPPSIGAIGDQACFVGDALSIPLSLSGDPGEAMSTNHTCLTAGVTGTYTTDGAVFEYTPSAADAETNGGEIWFRIEYVIDNLAATNDFKVAVSVKPDFLEGFECLSTMQNYINTRETVLAGDAASWCGTNYLVNGAASDQHNGSLAVRFRNTGSAYIEMATDKQNGAGEISFWHGKVTSDTTKVTGTIDVFISNNKGTTWNKVNSEDIIVSNVFKKTTLENVNVGGDIRLRFVYTGTKTITLDDIMITDYEGAAVIEPAIGEIAGQTIHADESCEIGIVFYGDEGLTRGVECTTPGVDAGRYNLDSATGTFTFTPSLDDLALNGGVIGFTISLKEGGAVRASRSFNVTLLEPIAKWLELRAGNIIREGFDSIGGAAEAALPAPWHVASTNALECFSALSYALNDGARDTTTQRAKFGAGTMTSGIYNLGATDDAEDRAVGFLSASGNANKFRTCALMVPLKNMSSSAVSQLSVQFTWEKWRAGKAKKLDFCYSTGAPDWVWTKIDGFHRGYDAEEGSAAFIAGEDSAAWAGSDNDIEKLPIRGKVNVEIPANGILYLGWFYSASDANSVSAQVWAIDDVRIVVGNTEATTVIMR